MPIIYCYPSIVSQNTGDSFRSFKDLNNIKSSSDSSFAVSNGLIHGKKGTPPRQPSTITARGFNANLPVGAEVKKVTVEYRQQKVKYKDHSTNNGCKIGFVGFNGGSQSGKAPTTTSKVYSNVFTVSPDVNTINSSDFGVSINYLSNTNNYEGYIRVYWIRLKIEYVESRFGLDITGSRVTGLDDVYFAQFTLNNLGGTQYKPSVTITVPLGFNFAQLDGVDNLTQVNARTFVWTPQAGVVGNDYYASKKLGMYFKLDVAYSNHVFTGLIEAVESLNGASRSFNVTLEEPTSTNIETTPTEVIIPDETIKTPTNEIIFVKKGEAFKTDMSFSLEELSSVPRIGSLYHLELFIVKNDNWVIDCSETVPNNAQIYTVYNFYFKSDGELYLIRNQDDEDVEEFIIDEVGDFSLVWCHTDTSTSPVVINTFFGPLKVQVYSDSLVTPICSLLKVDGEELNRLGDGYSYICQSNLKLGSDESYVHDWGKNYRLGVFNNLIESNLKSFTATQDTWYITDDECSATVRVSKLPNMDSKYILRCDDDVYLALGNNYLINAENPYNLTKKASHNNLLWFAQANTEVVTVYIDFLYNDEVVATSSVLIDFSDGGGKNLSIVNDDAVDFTDYTALTVDEIFENAVYWSEQPVSSIDSLESLECPFVYNDDYPLYIIVTGDYLEGNPESNIITFTEPCIVEKDDYTGRKQHGNYPVEILNLISEDETDTAEISLDTLNSSESVVFYDLPVEDGFGTNETMAIRGIGLQFNVEQADELTLVARLKNPVGEIRERSVIIDDAETSLNADNIYCIGGLGDLWGFSTLELTDLVDWEVELKAINNLSDSTATINFGGVKLVFYVETVEDTVYNCFIDGENTGFYGVYLIEPKIPFGLETDVNYLTIDGTDINDAYRQNITTKEIELKFGLDNCSLENSTVMLQQFIKLLTNERDKYNRPIPKRIEFSHLPDLYAEYIMKSNITPDILISDYNFTVKLEIPAGTFYNKKATTTSNSGFVQGLASVSPNICFSPTGKELEVLETNSNQKFNITYKDTSWVGKIVEIDCNDRICWLKENEEDTEPINISAYVDINSDWFKLHNEYNFETVNCVIRTVDYIERW